jgi:hypothetical protein
MDTGNALYLGTIAAITNMRIKAIKGHSKVEIIQLLIDSSNTGQHHSHFSDAINLYEQFPAVSCVRKARDNEGNTAIFFSLCGCPQAVAG